MKTTKKAFTYALILGLLIFLTDKIFLIQKIKEVSIYYKKVEIFFYESRYNLFEFFKQNNKGDYSLILGSSRSGMFSNQDIQELIPYPIHSYNFSAPLAGTSFYYYWIEKFIKNKEITKKPKFILMELDAVNLGEPSLRISLPFSYDPIFIIRYTNFYRNLPSSIPQNQMESALTSIFNNANLNGFNADEMDSYFIRYFFIIAKYDIHPLKIKENLKQIDHWNSKTNQIEKVPVYQIIQQMRKEHIQNFYKTYGGIPVEFYTKVSPENLPKDAEKTFLRILPKPELSTTQLIFLKNILESCKEYNIPLIIYKPPMTIYANEILKKYNLYKLESITKILLLYKNVFYIDASELDCKEFTDSVHLSPECYKKLAKFIFSEITKKLLNF